MNKYMMATKAIHQTGDISSDIPDLCFVRSDDGENYYIGEWIFGIGFLDVKFPKNTTRELNDNEIEEYHGTPYFIGSNFAGIINITGENYEKLATLEKTDGSTKYFGSIISPVKVGNQIVLIQNNGKWTITSKVVKIESDLIHTKNSVYKILYHVA